MSHREVMYALMKFIPARNGPITPASPLSLSGFTRYLSRPTFYLPLILSSTLRLNTVYDHVCFPLQTHSASNDNYQRSSS